MFTDIVHLETELHGQTAPSCLEHRLAIRIQVAHAALDLVRNVPDLGRLTEVVDVLREAELVHAAPSCSLHEPFGCVDGVLDSLS